MRVSVRSKQKLTLRFDNTQLTVLFVSLVVVLSLTFTLGLLVGKRLGTSVSAEEAELTLTELDTKHKNEVEAIMVSTNVESEVKHDVEELEFYEKLSGEKKKVSYASISTKNKSKNSVKKETIKKKKQKKQTVKVAKKPKESKKSKDEIMKNAVSKIEKSDHIFSIQVASVRTVKDASRMIKKLKIKGFSAFNADADSNRDWYRIKLNRTFNSKADAEKFRRNFENRHQMKTLVVQTKL